MKTILQTERLLIAEADHNDADFIFELLNSATWLKFIGDKGIKTKKQALAYIDESLIGSYKKNGFGLYKLCLKSSLIPVGLCGFLQRDYLDHPDIGFALLPEFEGQGLMLEACNALMNHAKSKLKFECVLAIVLPTNGRSCRLLEKMGLQQIGTVTPKTGGQELLLFSNKKSHSN
ncbi:GNAT family N-acetyltransferase [Flagellimonas iocasae]|uniref:GNAT family N-acetyltransferase n=1 Tax=Flagellimonas iocasae TaxID=2055905 RepID=A0ABW4XZX6_9FLAO